MAELIDEGEAQLSKRWDEIVKLEKITDTTLPQNLREAIKQCINSKTLSYRYVLPTQLLAKVVNHTLDCRSIQASSGMVGAFDARSLCHKVMVRFDQRNEKVLGGSKSPYLNNPLRVGSVSSAFRKDKDDKVGWDTLCYVLDTVEQKNDPQFTKLVFEQVLIEVHNRLDQVKVTYPTPTRVSIASTLELIETFITTPSGGEHPQAVAFATFKTIGKLFGLYDTVRREKINASDASSDQIADIECLNSNQIVMATEVKDKVLTVEEMKPKIDEARSKRVSEILFIAEQGVSDPEKVKEIQEREFSSGQNIYISNLMELLPPLLIILGEDGRRVLLDEICKTLDEYADIKSRQLWAKMLSAL